MTTHLFLGGPLAGWHESYGGLHNVRYPIMPPVVGFESAADILSDRVHSGIGTYTRRRLWSTSWRIVLTVYTCDQAGPWEPIPDGTVLPGWVQGVQLEQCRLCRRCRGRLGVSGHSVCHDCFAHPGTEWADPLL